MCDTSALAGLSGSVLETTYQYAVGGAAVAAGTLSLTVKGYLLATGTCDEAVHLHTHLKYLTGSSQDEPQGSVLAVPTGCASAV